MLSLDLWYDEVYTLNAFVSQPVSTIVTDYSAANNHVFYSLVLRPFYLLSDSNYVLRLPSLLMTLGTLWCVFVIGRRWSGLAAGLLAALGLGLNQMFLGHTMQVRGYSLSMLLFTWLCGLSFTRPPSASSSSPNNSSARRQAWWPLFRRLLIALVGAGLAYCIPTNVIFLVSLALVALLVATRRGGREFSLDLLAWVGAGLLGALCYLPIWRDVLRAGGAKSPFSFAALGSLAERFFVPATTDLGWLLVVIPLGLLVFAWSRLRGGQGYQALLLLVPVSVTTLSLLFTAILGISPFARNFCPLLPLLALLLGWTLAELFLPLGRLAGEAARGVLPAVPGALLLGIVLGPRLWTYAERLDQFRAKHPAQDGYYNYYAARFHPQRAVGWLQQTLGDRQPYMLCFSEHDQFCLLHYLQSAGMRVDRLPDQESGLTNLVVFLIAPAQIDYESVASLSGIPPGALRQFRLVKDFGYYRVYRSPPQGRMSTRSGE